jgi:hypothetical protein
MRLAAFRCFQYLSQPLSMAKILQFERPLGFAGTIQRKYALWSCRSHHSACWAIHVLNVEIVALELAVIHSLQIRVRYLGRKLRQ